MAAHNPRRGTVATYSAGQVGYARSTYVTVGGAAGTGTHRERARLNKITIANGMHATGEVVLRMHVVIMPSSL